MTSSTEPSTPFRSRTSLTTGLYPRMRKSYTSFLLLLGIVLGTAHAQPITGLEGWSIYLDPGHSQNENVGVYGYSEANKVLRVGLELRDLLLQYTDVDTVYMSRTNDQVSVSLAQRVDHANNVAASYYHSIHSNAGGPTANTVFVLWPQYRDGTEAVPNGGRSMADIMSDLLGSTMRIPSLGGIGECDFYGVASCRDPNLGTGKGGSRNFVQSFTDMASALSEAGFHTNPTQNQRNMNADWKRMEARTMFWSILEFHGLERLPVNTALGIVSNIENGMPINGAAVTVDDTTYVTDTFESLFNQYSNDPDQLHNGFYYLDRLDQGMLGVTVQAEGYEDYDGMVETDEGFFTFHDIELVSTMPPVVTSSHPLPEDDRHPIIDPIVIDFSRPMDRESVENAFSIQPAVEGTFGWGAQDTRVVFRPDTLLPETGYVVQIDASAAGALGHDFDGDSDGEPGGSFDLTFTTGPEDAFAPVLSESYPRPLQTGVERTPIVTVVFDEPLDEATVTDERFNLRPATGGDQVPGVLAHYLVEGISVVSFFPQNELEGEIYYTFAVEPGVADRFGNGTATRRTVRFRTTDELFERTHIDPFEPSEDGVWWQPQESGSTTGIVTDSTSFNVDEGIVNLLTASTRSRRLDYGWDTEAETHLIREYLGGGTARNEWFDDTYVLRVYVFGDGSGNQFRFAIDEDDTGHEVSPWYTIDWRGWRLVSWDLSEGETGTWIGDGALDPPFRIDSFQLTHADGSPAFGAIWFDDLHLGSRQVPIAAENARELPQGIELYQNYPNPFNPATTFQFGLGSASQVKLSIYNALGREIAVAVDEILPAGMHEVRWNASGLPSGVYFARLEGLGVSESIRIVLLK